MYYIDNTELRLRGARFATISMLIGCAFLVLIELFPRRLTEPTSFGLALMPAIMFSMPFSIIGGYVLVWLLQHADWYRYNIIKIMITGAMVASVTLLVIFIIGTFFVSCFGEGRCLGILGVITQEVLPNPSFLKALLIAAICGGITASRLSRLAQQKTA